MIPARLSDETLRDYAERFYLDAHPHTTGDIRDMARELLALRARVAELAAYAKEREEGWDAAAKNENERQRRRNVLDLYEAHAVEAQGFRWRIDAALAALAGRGD